MVFFHYYHFHLYWTNTGYEVTVCYSATKGLRLNFLVHDIAIMHSIYLDGAT